MTVSKTENLHPEAVFVVAGDFSQASLRQVLAKYFQHIDTFRNAFKPLLHANQITPSSCSCQLIARNRSKAYAFSRWFAYGLRNGAFSLVMWECFGNKQIKAAKTTIAMRLRNTWRVMIQETCGRDYT